MPDATRLWLGTHLRLVYLFLYLPIAVLMVLSFNRAGLPTVWSGFSVKWYGALLDNAAILNAGALLFFLMDEAKLIVAKNNAKGFEPVAQYDVAESATWAHPVIVGGKILIKDASTLALWSME